MARRPIARKSPRHKPVARARRRSPTRVAEATIDPAQRGSAAAALSDEAVEEALRTGDHPALLEDLFGTPGYAQLRGLAQQAAARSVRGGERVLIVPGICGSRLGYRLGPIPNVLWIDPISIAAGRLTELRLKQSGDPGRVRALGVLLFAYLALKLRLRIGGYDAEFAAFDWRLSVSRLGAELAKEIDRTPGVKTHLVAHSMGGLVARAALAHKPANLERVVTLGTPNFGSYSPIQAFRGVHSIVQKVAFLDLKDDQRALAGVFGTFPGLLEMIPSPQQRPRDLFDLANWPTAGTHPDAALLHAAEATQAALPLPTENFRLIVGLDNETVVNTRLDDQRGEFLYDLSMDGDGTVPLDLARVSGLQTWVTTTSHGNMPNSESIARAVGNLLATGETTELPTLEERLGAAPRRSAVTRAMRESDLRTRALEGRRGRAPSPREQRNLVQEFAAPPDAEAALAAPAAAALLLAPPAVPEAAEPQLLSNFVVSRRERQRLDI